VVRVEANQSMNAHIQTEVSKIDKKASEVPIKKVVSL